MLFLNEINMGTNLEATTPTVLCLGSDISYTHIFEALGFFQLELFSTFLTVEKREMRNVI